MSDTSGSGFGKFVPGFDFLQSLIQPAGAATGMAQMPSLGNWVAPTFNVEDLEKRIEELKAVHFWLDQNTKALSATIQAMEVQKMTLATLRDLNVNFGDVAKAGEASAAAAAESASKAFASFGAAASPAPAPAAAPAPAPEPAPEPEPAPQASAAAQPGGIDPVQWWGALQQQFQNIASVALKDLAHQQVPPVVKKAKASKTAQAKAEGRAPARAPRAAAPSKKPAAARPRAGRA